MKMKRLSIAVFAASLAAGSFAQVDSSNTFAQMEVGSPNVWTLLALPWVTPGSSNGNEIVLTNLVLTAGLSEDDLLLRHTGEAYECWKVSDGKWVPAITVGIKGISQAPDPATASFPRGIGVWLKRTNDVEALAKPILLYGQVRSDDYGKVTVPAKTSALVACPKATDLVLKTFGGGNNDEIKVQVGNEVLLYTYKTNDVNKMSGWCTNATVEVVTPFGKQKKAVFSSVGDDVTIPAGLGFFYTNRGASEREINW